MKSWTMRNQYRVSKYDPSLRDDDGAFRREEWTSRGDVGRVFNGVPLTDSAYRAVEAAYLFAVESLLCEAKVDTLYIHSLENPAGHKLPSFIQTRAVLSVTQCVEFARMVLREMAWGKLVAPGRAYVHFGYDYYMYLGLPYQCRKAIAAVQQRGLFVESCRSPYLRRR